MTAPADDFTDAALLDALAEEREHPVPHPGCAACDPAIVRSRRAHAAGLPTRAAGAPNRVRFVAIEGGEGVLAVPVEET